VKTVAVTGADGFLGIHLCSALESQGYGVRRLVRRPTGAGADRRVIADLTDVAALAAELQGADVAIHLAARAHVMQETHRDVGAAFRRVNVDGTRSLCTAAARSSVRRIVFISSIGVNGASTSSHPFTEADVPNPIEPYARSKWEAELALRECSSTAGLQWVVVRPPLIYGPGVKGNFLRLLQLARSGIPLPLGSIANRRSLIGVRNLSDLLILCVESPAAVGQTYVAAEPQTHSTADLVRALRRNFGRADRIFGMPQALLRSLARVMRVESQFDKLCGSLEVCSDKARRELGWNPRVTFDAEIARTTAWYMEARENA
jgi:nucleoside-diphosphate-sugar epimerase